MKLIKTPFYLLFILCLNPCLGQENEDSTDAEPTFPGGIKAFYEYVNETLTYPEIARASDIEGTVFVQFVVDKTGKVTQVKAVKGPGAGCNKEAERILKNAPDFIPAKEAGNPVNRKIILPIIFSLGKMQGIQPVEVYSPPATSLDMAINNPNHELLVLKFQKLDELDVRIGIPTQLIHLNLTGNNLKTLPEEIGALQNLEELLLTYNLLEELPSNFSELQGLRTLYLDRNELNEFPEQVLALKNLETIDISYTQIRDLPEQIATMPNLNVIYARGTSISSEQIDNIRAINSNIDILK